MGIKSYRDHLLLAARYNAENWGKFVQNLEN